MKLKYLASFAALALCVAVTACGNDKKDSKNSKDTENDELATLSEQTVETPEQNDDNAADWIPKNATIRPSGLGIVIENPGNDVKPGPQSLVTVNYTGRLTNGTVFDASNLHGGPVQFSPSQVIPGFSEGLQLIGVGGKATLYIPGELAYGPQAIPEAGIGPNENLIFDIEILDVK